MSNAKAFDPIEWIIIAVLAVPFMYAALLAMTLLTVVAPVLIVLVLHSDYGMGLLTSIATCLAAYVCAGVILLFCAYTKHLFCPDSNSFIDKLAVTACVESVLILLYLAHLGGARMV